MSTSDKPDPARAWQYAEKLFAEDVEKFDHASDEEIERQMDAQGVRAHPGMASPEELIARVEARAKKPQRVQATFVPARVQRLPRTRLVALLAAAAIGALAITLIVERRQIVALFHPEAPREHNAPNDALVLAKAFRQNAFEACENAEWTECENYLDQAKSLDPNGETDDRVARARQALEAWHHPPPAPSRRFDSK